MKYLDLIKGNKKGFTFVEVIIVLSLFIVLSGIGIAAYFDYYKFSLIKNDVSSAFTLVKETRFRALKNPTNTNYGIHIDVPTRTVTGFEGTYNPLEDTNQDVVLEQLDIKELFLNPTPGTTNEIIFEAQTGKTVNYGSFTIGNDNFEKIISINSQGVVK